ncbi:MAG: helix-turn-helix domain-containing protein [Anaerolineae bacterium]|jgi:excisionase family DNA binding protein
MSTDEIGWLSLTEASDRLGVHPSTLRRWADAGDVPCFRTPGGHRRFRHGDLLAWMQGQRATALVPLPDALVQSAVGYTRHEMARQGVSHESWYAAFQGEEARQQMRDTGRRLFGLAVQYMSRTRDHEPVLQEGRRIGDYYGQQSARRGVSLADTVRALFFFRESLLRAAKPGQANPGQYDAEDVRIHRQLRHFLDEVMYACLDSYEAACRHLLMGGDAS